MPARRPAGQSLVPMGVNGNTRDRRAMASSAATMPPIPRPT